MKLKMLGGLKARTVRKQGNVMAAQACGKVLVLDCFRDGKRLGRYCIDTETYEYALYLDSSGKWNRWELSAVFGYDPLEYQWKTDPLEDKVEFAGRKDRKLAREMLKGCGTWPRTESGKIHWMEQEYNRERRQRRRELHDERVRREMDAVPPLPDGLGEWLHGVLGGEDFLFYEKEKACWSCSACGDSFPKDGAWGEDGKRPVHNGWAVCPGCGRRVRVKTRTGSVDREEKLLLIRPFGGDGFAASFVWARVSWSGRGRETDLEENIRVVGRLTSRGWKETVYYRNWIGWNDRNTGNWRFPDRTYLYTEGLEAFLEDLEGKYTRRERAAAYIQFAKRGICMDYWTLVLNGKLSDREAAAVEMLFRGRFYRLMGELWQKEWRESCTGAGCALDLEGDGIRGVFRIRDKQKINRIRDRDGGLRMVAWMQEADQKGWKLEQEDLDWLLRRKLLPREMEAMLGNMSPKQAVHYIRKQQASGYAGMPEKQVVRQYEDYMSMCRVIGKDLTDELVYRPRDLKLRHGEAVEEYRKAEMMERIKKDRELAEKTARTMRERYPGAEEILEEIRGKYEYRSDPYMVVVPRSLAEISAEGYALHHCAGASDRYFERICRRETYICFLRRTEEPDVPFYTLEVEPGGTIRQHRSMYDEEPGIEKIRGFLREWQREVRNRLSSRDRELAASSARLREENIRQLQEENNTRVLKGLLEDFMEAEAI